VEVPVGTIVRNPEGAFLCDLDRPGCLFLAARGGSGGKGNAHFKSSTNRTPKISEVGADGEVLDYSLELRFTNLEFFCAVFFIFRFGCYIREV
jgi:GTP-binding protein